MNVELRPRRIGAVALILACLWTTSVSAEICGDPTDQGHVSVTDGVVVLRTAVGLSSECKPSICDVNLDGHVGVTDGVLVLRVAASLPSQDFTCSEEEVPRQIARFGNITKIAPQSASSARLLRPAAPMTVTCPVSGHTELRDDGYQDFACNDGQTITDGFVAITDRPGADGVDVVFDGYLVHQIEPAEQRTLKGSLFFVLAPNSTTDFLVNGFIDTSSDVRGDFRDSLIDAVVSDTPPTQGQILAGKIRTDVMRGSGPYANLLVLETELISSGLRIAHLSFVDGGTSGFLVGGESRLCTACTDSGSCGEALTCRSCSRDCTGSTQRCAVGDPTATCEDGEY